jgi:DNA (cytosine-5)-methyltransferase 1
VILSSSTSVGFLVRIGCPGLVGPTTRLDGPLFDRFIHGDVRPRGRSLPSVSLFSGAGVGDFGYKLAGFSFKVFAELARDRLAVCRLNHGVARYVQGDLRVTWPNVVNAFRGYSGNTPPALLSGMPPCQAMSCANAWVRPKSRGAFSTDPRNSLSLVLTQVAAALKPRIIVFENVPGVFNTRVRDPELDKTDTIAQIVIDRLPDYECWPAMIQFADYGVPQRRLRALFTFIRRGDPAISTLLEPDSLPYPEPSHSRTGIDGEPKWITAKEFLGPPRFRPLDAASKDAARDPDDPLHFVPVYDANRYEMVRLIPPNSGRSAFDTDVCPRCNAAPQPPKAVRCVACREPLHSRPIAYGPRGRIRLIVGSDSTYKRMPPHLPVTTVTTANGHLGSDSKIHPWENRLLSPRECAGAQTIPRSFRWASEGERPTATLLRKSIGESIPPWFTYQHGLVLRSLILNSGKVATGPQN